MSILLDAVSRSKQPVGASVLDPVVSPRPYSSSSRRGSLLPRTLWLPSALTLAVSAAWWLSQWSSLQLVSTEPLPSQLQPAAVQSVSVDFYQAPAATGSLSTSPTTQAIPLSQTLSQHDDLTQLTGDRGRAPTALPEHEEPIAPMTEASGFRLAGKSALPSPVRQAADPQNTSVATAVPVNGIDGLEVGRSEKALQPQQTQMSSWAMGSEPGAVDEDNGIDLIAASDTLQAITEVLVDSEKGAAMQNRLDRVAAELGLHRTAPPVSTDKATRLRGEALVKAFEDALKEVEFTESANRDVTPAALSTIPETSDYPRYGDLPSGLQLKVPEFNIMAHVYANNPQQRWLNVDGTELQEGDSIRGSLKILEIRPRDVVLAIEGTAFKVPAI